MQGDWRLVDIEHVVEAFERIRQRVEVLACANVVCSQVLHDLIARCAEELFVKDYREVRIVRLDILLDGVELQAIDIAEAFAIARHCLAAFRNLFIDMTQIADAHRRAELIHLRISTDSIHLLRATDAEVLQAIELLTKLLIAESRKQAAPPSIEWKTFVAWKLKQETSPKAAVLLPLYLTPNVCAAS